VSRDDDDEIDKRPYNRELADMLHGAIRAKARFVAFAMAIAVSTFVWLARDAGQPLWLVIVIGVLGAVLIAFFVALVWFWLRFLSHFRGRD
jgi:apolipoprotein N-acyltransferase